MARQVNESFLHDLQKRDQRRATNACYYDHPGAGGLVGVKKGLIFISGADCECVWNFKQGQVNIKKDVTPPTQERNEGATKGELIIIFKGQGLW